MMFRISFVITALLATLAACAPPEGDGDVASVEEALAPQSCRSLLLQNGTVPFSGNGSYCVYPEYGSSYIIVSAIPNGKKATYGQVFPEALGHIQASCLQTTLNLSSTIDGFPLTNWTKSASWYGATRVCMGSDMEIGAPVYLTSSRTLHSVRVDGAALLNGAPLSNTPPMVWITIEDAAP